MLIGGPSVRTAWRWVGGWRSWRNSACDIYSLTDVGQVRVALLIGPVRCSGGGKYKLIYGYCIRFSLSRSLTLAALTFAGRHVDTFAITAHWVWPPEGPGHIIEHRVVGPAETAIIFVGVKPQPPVFTLRFRHLKVRQKLWKCISRPQSLRLLIMHGLPVKKVAMQTKDTIITQVCTC